MADIFEHGGRRLSAALLAALLCIFATGVAFGAAGDAVVDSATNGTLNIVNTGGNDIIVSNTGTEDDPVLENDFKTLTVSGVDYRPGNDVILSNGGIITVVATASGGGGDQRTYNGSMHFWDIADDANPSNSAKTLYVKDGGKLNVGNGTLGGYVETGRFVMDGGEVSIGGQLPNQTSWLFGSWLTAGWEGGDVDETGANDAAVSITGGTVNVGSYGYIQTTAGGSGEQLFYIGGDAEINLTGVGSALRANDTNVRRPDGTIDTTSFPSLVGYDKAAKMVIDGGTINVSGESALLARDLEMNGGAINVTGSGNLIIAGAAGNGAELIDVGLKTNPNNQAWGELEITGGTITTTGNGVIDLVTADMDLKASGGSITGGLIIDDTAGSKGIFSKNLDVAAGGTFTVDNLTVDKVATSGSGATGGVTIDGTLTVTGNIAVSNDPSVANSIVIGSSGTLAADLGNFLTAVDSNGDGIISDTEIQTKTNIQNAIDNTNGGDLYLDNSSLSGMLSKNAYDKIVNDLGNVSAITGLTVDGFDKFSGISALGTLTVASPIMNAGFAPIINASPTDIASQITFQDPVTAGGLSFGGLISPTAGVRFEDDAVLTGVGGVLFTNNGAVFTPSVTAVKGITLGTLTPQTSKIGGIINSLTLDDAGSGLAHDVKVQGGDFTITSIARKASSTGVVNVDLKSASLSLGSLNLYGGDLTLVDSDAAVGSFPGDVTDGNIGIGQKGYLLYGTDDVNWMNDRIGEALAGVTVTSGLGIVRPLTIGNGYGVVVGSASTPPTVTPDNITFESGSLLIVDAQRVGTGAAINSAATPGAATANISGASLYVYNATATGMQVFNDTDFGTISGSWSNIISDSYLLTNGNFNNATGAVSFTLQDANKVYSNLTSGTAGMLDTMYGGKINNIGDANKGIDFLSRATSEKLNGTDKSAHIAAIEGATGISAVGGTQLQTLMLNDLNTTAVRERFAFSTGFAQDATPAATARAASDTAFANVLGSAASLARGRLALWATPAYQHLRTSGMNAGAFDNSLRGDMGGGTIGVDYTAGDNVRFGLAGHFGGGRNKTRGTTLPYTENDFSYAGFTAFVGWSSFNWSVLLDGGYLFTDNDLSQTNRFASVSADPKVHGWNVGLNAEHRLSAGFIDVIPHVGVRYEGVNTRGHGVTALGGTAFNVASDTQHLLTVPVGFRVGKAFVAGRWTVSPYADLGARLTFGDRDYAANYTATGVAGSYGHKATIADTFAFDGKVGVQMENGKFFGGLDYNLLTSKDTTAHTLSATIGVSF